MNAKKIARLLELIKYFTFKRGLPKKGYRIIFTANANVSKTEEIEDKYIELSGNYSFNIESLVIDYGAEFSSSLQSKEIKIYFGKYPTIGSMIGSGPDYKYDIIDDPNGLMTPAIIQNYVKDGKSFKRYIFPSDQDDTYSFDYKTFDEWHQTTLKNVNENYSRPRSMTILVEESISSYFENFLNESLVQWESRFNNAKDLAKSGDFYWFSLYDPKIYEYALSFEDRKSILNYMVYSLSWTYIFEGYGGGINGVDEYELFASLITSTSKDDGKKFYDYMFTIDSLTGKTNLQVYKDKLDDDKLYSALLQTLMKFFYSTKEIAQFKEGFQNYLLYPIGLYESFGSSNLTFNLDTQKNADPGPNILGVKYKISTIVDVDTGHLKIKVNSAYRYKGNANLRRLEFEEFTFIGHNEKWNYDDIIYVTSFLSNQKLEGLDIPYGSVMPIPAFALPWLVEINNETEDIIDLIEEGATYAGVIFPIFEIFEGVGVIYNIIGLGFTLTNNALDAGLKDQIKQFDVSKSTTNQPYTEGSDFLETYYLFSAIYGGISLGKAIEKAENKIKVLIEFETLLGMKGVLGDIDSYMTEHSPENIDSLNIIENEMNKLEIDCKNYQFLKKGKK